MADSKFVLETPGNPSDSSRKQIFWMLEKAFLSYENVRFVYSLELPDRADCNEYTQRTIILKKNEKTPLNYYHLPPDLAP